MAFRLPPSYSRHSHSALRTCHLIAWLSAHVRHCLPTVRAEAGATRPPDASARSPAPPLATRHHKRPVRQLTPQKRIQHFLHGSADEADYAHARGSQSCLQRPGYRAADEDLRSQAQQLGRAGQRIAPQQPPRLPVDLPPILNVDEQQIAGDIEDWGYAALPMWNRDPHRTRLGHMTCQNRQVELPAGDTVGGRGLPHAKRNN
jgi:hypothetical protein